MRAWFRLLPSAVRRRPVALVGALLLGLALVFAAGATLASSHQNAKAARLDVTPLAPNNNGQNGTTLTVTLDATGHLVKTFHWGITKTVSPRQWDLFRGDNGTSQYTISLAKDNGTLSAYFDGQICVINGGSVATENLKITAEVILAGNDDTASTDDDAFVIASAPVDLSSEPIIPSAAKGCYNYRVDLSSNITPGGSYKVLADTTITNHSGDLGNPHETEPATDTFLPADPTLVNDTVHVVDTNGGSWIFSAGGSVSYPLTFTCDADAGNHPNTATIQETGQHDSANVQVNCWALTVAKTAATSLTRTINWNISKVCNPISLVLQLGQSYVETCSVAVGATHTDSNWVVSGTITVHNPAPMAAPLTGIADVLSVPGTPVISCGVTFPYSLPAQSDLICTYAAALSGPLSGTNTATATLQNYSFDSVLHATPAGTTDFASAAVPFDFTHPVVTAIDTQVTVSDDLTGTILGVCTYKGTDGLQCFYPAVKFTIGTYATCGDRTVTNTATFVTTNTGATGSSSSTIIVHVPCSGGCTLTIGYWKTHAGFTGNNPDRLTQFLPIWLGASGGAKSVQATSASQAAFLLGMSGDASNGINKLYAQLLGAKLNIAAGANGSAISTTIAAADAFLSTYNSGDWSSLSKTQQQYVLNLMTILNNYNNGLVGPGHCTE